MKQIDVLKKIKKDLPCIHYYTQTNKGGEVRYFCKKLGYSPEYNYGSTECCTVFDWFRCPFRLQVELSGL